MSTDANDLTSCLKATPIIDSDHEAVRTLAKGLTASFHDDAAKARSLFYFVRDSIRYNAYMISTHAEDFVASTVLARESGYCVQKAVLLAALARAAGIPSRLVFAKIRNYKAPSELALQTGLDNVFPRHGYTQLFIQGRWTSVAPTLDRELCERIGVPVVEFDGVNDAMLPPRDLAGNPYIEYIEKYECHADLPFAWLRERIVLIWGEKRAWLTPDDGKGHTMPSGYVFE